MSFGKGYVVLLEVLVLAVCSYADPVEEWITFSSFSATVYDMVIDSYGNVYLAGSGILSERLGYDFATAKYDTNGNEQWAEAYDGGNGGDRAKALVMDSQGNIYVTGSSASANGDDNIVTIKYSNDGVRQWVRRHDINVNGDYPIGICIDSSDNIYVAGTTLNYDDYLNTIITIKYDDNGDTQWINECDYESRFYDIASDRYGNVYVTGECSAGFATVKYDTDGEEEWTSCTEEGSIPYAGIALDSSGNVYVSGRDSGDYITVKIDSAGTEQWVVQYDYDGYNDCPQAIVADSMGNIFITGYGFEDIGYDPWPVYLTVMYNSDGDMVWQRNHTYYMDWSKASDLCLDEESNVYVTGMDYSPYDNGWGYTTIKYSIAGDQEWIIHTDDTRAATNIALDAQNNVYVTGKALNETLWATVKYNQQLGIDPSHSEGIVSLQLSPVYPNPNCGSFNIYFSTPTSTYANIRIYDIAGKLVSSVSRREYSSGSHELQFDGVVPGIYICRIDSESASVSRSFVVID